MRIWIFWSCLLVQASFSVASAQVAEPAQPVIRDSKVSVGVVVDYGSAFERLIKLGLPDAKGAKYVKLTLHGEAGQAAKIRSYQYGMGRSVDLGTKGNAWLLPDRKDGGGLATLIHVEYETVKVKKKQKRGGLMRLLVGPQKSSKSGGTAGDWTEKDAAADAKEILKALENESESGRFFSADRWQYSDSEARWCAGVLVQACHLYRAGFTQEANRITAKLLGSAPESVRVIDHVVNHLAQRKYKILTDHFIKDKDWVAYRDGSKNLLEKFTRGWKSSEGVKILVQKLDQRIKGDQPELTKLKGVSLKPEAVALMDGLLAQEEAIVVDAQMCWILGAETLKRCAHNPNVGYYLTPSKQKWVNEIGALGMDGLIALSSAVTDDALMATKMGTAQNDYSSYSRRSYAFGGGDDDAAVGVAQYAALDRPCSRGDIARKMLERTLPDSENELSSMSAAELQSISHQWWLKHRSDSSAQLVRHFFKEGNSQQKLIAGVALIMSSDAADAELMEEFMMGNDRPDKNGQMVMLYLKEKKGKAKPFFDRYSKALKEYADGLEKKELDWQIRQAGGVDKFLKKLEVYVKEVSPDKILADIRSGKLEGKEGLGMLKIALPDGELVKHLPTIVNIARHQKKLKDQVELLDELVLMLNQEYYAKLRGAAKPDEGNKEYEKFLTTLIEPSKEDWQWFLRQTASVEDRKLLNGAPSLAAYIAWQIEHLYFPQHQSMMYVLNRIMNTDELWQFGLARGRAILKDGAEAYYPDPKNVGDARKTEIRESIQRISAKNTLKYYQGLNMEEKLAWSDILGGFEGEIPDSIIKARGIVCSIDWSAYHPIDVDMKRKIDDLMLGRQMSQDVIDAILKLLLLNAENHHDLVLSSNGGGWLTLGVKISILRGDSAEDKKARLSNVNFISLGEGELKKVAGFFLRGERRQSASKIIGEPKIEIKESEKEESNPAKEFEELCKLGDYYNFMFVSETAESYKERLVKKSAEKDDE